MISIIGSGKVGTAIAFLCITNSLDDILFVNRTKSKAIGEALDISNAIPANSNVTIHGTDDFSKISGSNIVVITASTGTYLKSRTEMMDAQVKMIKEISNKIKKYCPSAIVLVVSNPLDVLTFIFQKETQFSRNKVIGIASSLDSSRFRYLLSEKFGIKQSQITDALVMGEHGDSMVPIFSRVKINGKNVSEMLNDSDKKTISTETQNYWRSLRLLKTRSEFGIAKNTFDVIRAIIDNDELVIPASIVLNGEYGEKDVALGIPVKINKNGIKEIIEIKLNEQENKLLKISAQTIRNYIKSL
ncbi:malate dehydrogenase [Candidatus Nitrosarchaeum limnium]|uniref:Lactate/malate dehydrogenase, NAD binding domain protein n=1 Tax=Candidatus Nitrosarchaeum limnium BG20 TaxID=859192 RepID=S2E7W3_9ARCH|nr:lactate dehydrogenase [Candidatus Nitrosarchaeum limnium]EPA06818.1 lactate/malate dehydrogenase, NAD binding domain protein [Candidatus Nitrosarchaeum limnium BG20]